jgi:methyl-accepting chemotaxis protein
VFKKISIKVAVFVCLVLLVVMTAGTWYIVNQQGASLENQLLERGRIEALVGAKLIGKVMEEAIDNGVFSVKDAFDQSYVPIPGFEPEKYHTKYDSYLDKAILAMEDEFLQDESVVYAVAVDVNGYLPTHNTRYQQPITGDRQKDLVGNRTKRIFNDLVGLKAAKNQEPLLQQIYNRDTGETMWDISAPILVKGKHWGGFRIGFSLEKTAQAKSDLTRKLSLIMFVILLLATVMVFVIVNRALAPLSHLTVLAGQLADGKVEVKIEKNGDDEIGQLADVLERLRVSLKAAMDRLTRTRSA